MDRENLCRRCGRCCELKVTEDGITGRRSGVDCPYLIRFDDGMTECAVYDTRMCLKADVAARMKLLPTDCPYVEGIESYEPVVVEYREVN